jgi:hypothetical protein
VQPPHFQGLLLDSNDKIKKFKCFIWCRLGARAAAALRLYEPETPFESSPLMVWCK